ncbi:hypothetical protein VTK56DRAFT_9916 [Thermocarpiscus australiensis]
MANASLLQQSAASLRALCASCGLPNSSPKTALYRRLRLAARGLQPLPATARILSIDLGLKNFAFSLLQPAPPSRPESSQSPRPPRIQPVHLHAWHRLDLTLPSSSSSSSSSGALSTTSATTSSEDFSPAAMAALTVDLVRTRLLPLRPTHVLIERQRFRTGGGAAVAEWTLRVNTLEAMLHAVFAAAAAAAATVTATATMPQRERGSEPGVVEVRAVPPRRVAQFLFPAGEEVVVPPVLQDGDGDGDGDGGRGAGKGKGTAYRLLKRGKVDLLGRWLAEGEMVVPQTAQAREMAGLFVDAWEGKGKGKGKGKADNKKEEKTAEKLVKMDDLSDAVLQGMVWLQWQRNLEALVKERPELLADMEDG